MKYILLIFTFVFSTAALSATCTTTTRTNYASGQVLTSSALNADFNQLVAKSNAFDGGCVTDGTLEASALKTTDFASVTNGIHQGCQLVFSDVNTIGVGSCILSVNGNFVKTTTQTNVTWGCSGCSSEVSSTLYYVYAKTGSTGSTLNLLISTSAPSADGYDLSGNKVLGKFFNNSAGSIDQYGPETWTNANYVKSESKVSNPGTNREIDSFWFIIRQSGTGIRCTTSPCDVLQHGDAVTSVIRDGAGDYALTTKRSYTVLFCDWTPTGMATRTGVTSYALRSSLGNTLSISTTGYNGTNYDVEDARVLVKCQGY